MSIYRLGDRTPSVARTAFVHPDAVVIGAVEVGPEATIWPGAVLRGDFGTITVGARTSVQDGTVVHTDAHHATVLGASCIVGHLAHLEGCVVEDGCLVGSGSVVLHRARVEQGATVGANAVIPNGMVVPSGSLAVGVPARIVPGASDQALIRHGAALYVDAIAEYRDHLERIG